MRNWAKICRLAAPKDARSATSRRRAAPRASSRLATLAHAISSTNPTAPRSSHMPAMVSRLRKLFCSGSTLALQPVFERGFSSAMLLATACHVRVGLLRA